MLRILSADLIETGIGNFASPKVQEELDPLLEGVELLVLDNLSSLTSVIRDNDAESWNPLQEWLLRLRRRGVSVLIVHHAGKGGERGRAQVAVRMSWTRRSRCGVPAVMLRLRVRGSNCTLKRLAGSMVRRPSLLRPSSSFMTRRLYGPSARSEDVNIARVKALLDDDMSIRDIADETGLSKSTVHRIKRRSRMNSARWRPILSRPRIRLGTRAFNAVPCHKSRAVPNGHLPEKGRGTAFFSQIQGLGGIVPAVPAP